MIPKIFRKKKLARQDRARQNRRLSIQKGDKQTLRRRERREGRNDEQMA